MAKRFTGIGVLAVLTAIGGFVALGACGGDSAVDGDCSTLPTCCTQLSDASNKELCEQIVATGDSTSCGEAQADFETDTLCRVSSGGGGGGSGCAGLMSCCGTLSGEDATLCADEVTASAGSDSECGVYLTSFSTCASKGTGTGTGFGGTGCSGLMSCCSSITNATEESLCEDYVSAAQGSDATCTSYLETLETEGECGSIGTGTSTGTGTGTGGGGTGCSGLSTCCGTLPSAEQSGCQTIVSDGVDSTCAAELTAYTDDGLCGSTGTGTGTGVGSGGCSALSTCCGSLPSTEQAGCQEIVSEGSDPTCSAELTAYMDDSLCN